MYKATLTAFDPNGKAHQIETTDELATGAWDHLMRRAANEFDFGVNESLSFTVFMRKELE